MRNTEQVNSVHMFARIKLALWFMEGKVTPPYNRNNLAVGFLLLGFIIGETLNGFETYNAFNCWEVQFMPEYKLAEYFDTVYYCFFGIGATLAARLLLSGYWHKQLCIFMLEWFLIDLVYCTFWNPFIFHFDKVVNTVIASGVYVIQFFFYRHIEQYKKIVLYLIDKILKR